MARTVTGTDNGADALAAVKANPALALQLQQSWLAHEVELSREETRQLAEINATMRAEAASGDGYVRCWRPTLGYAVALTWTATIWGIALGVLGVAVVKRSQDKTLRQP